MTAAALGAFALAACLAVVLRGLAGDEEALHFLQARFVPLRTDLLFHASGRPLLTLGLAVPAQLGLTSARIGAALASGLAAYAVGAAARRMGDSPLWAVLFLFLQPFFLAHAGTVMAEPAAAALVAGGILGHAERRPRLLAACAALLPLARPECFVLWIPAAVSLAAARGTRWIPLLPLPLAAWVEASAAASGDPMGVLRPLSSLSYPQREFLHYARSWAWTCGLGLFVPVLLGAIRFREGTGDGSGGDAGVRARTASVVVGGTVLLLYTVLASWVPVTYGNLRYLGIAAPAFALLGTAGVRALAGKPRRAGFLFLALAAGATLALWSRPLLGDFVFLSAFDPWPAAAVGVWFLLYAIPLRKPFPPAAMVAVALGAAGLFLHHRDTLHFEPAPEERTVGASASLLARSGFGNVPIHASHPLLAYALGRNPYDPRVEPPFPEDFPRAAGERDLWFWDSHYTPRRGEEWSLAALLRSGRWIYLGGLVSGDSTFACGFFLRRGPSPPDDAEEGTYLGAIPVVGGLGPAEWVAAAQTVEAGVGRYRRLVRADPGNPAFSLLLARGLETVGRTGEALAELDRGFRNNPGDPEFLLERALVLRRAGRREEATDVLWRYIRERPRDPAGYLRLAEVHRERGSPVEARRALEEGLQQIPGDTTIAARLDSLSHRKGP